MVKVIVGEANKNDRKKVARMVASAYERGVGGVLTIQGETPLFRKFYSELSPRLGHPPLDNLHLTLIDSAETAVRIYPERDLEITTLQNTQNAMAEYLGGLPLRELTLHPSNGGLSKLGNRIVIPFEDSPVVTFIRNALVEIVKEGMGVRLSNRDFVPHVSVIGCYAVGSRRVLKKPHPPQNVHVSGFSVGQRFFESRGSVNHSRRYVNRPHGSLPSTRITE